MLVEGGNEGIFWRKGIAFTEILVLIESLVHRRYYYGSIDQITGLRR